MATWSRPPSRHVWPEDGVHAPGREMVSCGADGRRVPLIALVDDEASIRRVLDRLLDQEGFAAVHAASLRQLIAAMEQQTVDGVLLDLGLRGEHSGLDALEWIRAQPQFAHTPVLILTGRADLTAADLAVIQRLGAQLFHKGQSLQPVITQLIHLLRPGNDE
jgi:DNA-binding response OmpR family regulator